MIDLHGKHAVVTGGGSGIGRGISEVLARAGASVFVADIEFASAELTIQTLAGDGEFLCYIVDVTETSSVNRMIESAIKAFGKIDVLVNNAGIIGTGKWWERETPNDEDWSRVHEVNVRGVVRVSESIVPHMKRCKYGKIVNIASIAARQGSPDLPHYSTTKAAVVSWTQSNALQLAPFNVNVNAICPGLLWTPMWESIARKRARFGGQTLELGSSTGREVFEQTVEQWIPMKREQTPEDIGNLAAFLASELARNITGQAINVDGGRFTN